MDPKLSTRRLLVRSAGTLGSMTFVSRVLGFVRDVLMAGFFGTGPAAEAFVVSWKIPNLFRDIVGEGAMNSAIVPVLSDTRARLGEAPFRRLASTLFWWFLAILTALSAAGTLFAPLVVHLAAPGFAQDPEKFALTVHLTRLVFPFIFFTGLSALFMGVLNTIGSFGSSALGPILLNMVMIASLLALAPYWGVKALVVGVLAGGLVQCGVQMASLSRKGFGPDQPEFFDPGVKRVLRLLLPRVVGTGIYQISVFVDTIIASFYWIVGAGGQSALYYSSRLFQLPLAIFGVSFAQASLPMLSGHHAKGDARAFKEAAVFSLRQIIFTTLPAAAGLAVFSQPITSILFKRGEFTDYSVRITSDALFFYAFGLLSCAAVKVLANAFYALHDTRTPVKTAFVSLAANLVFNVMFMWPLKIGGLALATTLSATLNAAVLYRMLERKIGPLDRRALLRTLGCSLAASAVMAAAAYFVLVPWVGVSGGGTLASVLKLAAAIAVGIIIYFVSALALRSDEAKAVLRAIKRK